MVKAVAVFICRGLVCTNRNVWLWFGYVVIGISILNSAVWVRLGDTVLVSGRLEASLKQKNGLY